MKTKIVPSSWLHRDGRRFDSGPYTSGALEAKIRLEELDVPKDKLASLTHGYEGGIYHAGREGRAWVDSPEYGVPFVGSSAILAADLTNLPLLSKKQVAANPKFVLRPGWILITRSGTIGRMVYSRPDMDGMACSEHVMRVVPNPDRVPPGYVYAFLSSKFGVPMVTSGTYGAIIQHIEPQHIADLPIPRLGDKIEQRTHELVECAALKRSDAVAMLKEAQRRIEDLLPAARAPLSSRWAIVQASQIQSRLDAYYFSAPCVAARRAFDEAATVSHRRLAEVAKVFIPGIFKRRYADPEYGFPYITGSDVFQVAPTSERYVLRSVADQYGLTVSKGEILIQEAGQLGGLIGRSVLVGNYLNGFAVSNNMIRVTAYEQSDVGYLFALLSTPEGVLLIGREAAGSSIPHIEDGRVRNIRIPWPSAEARREIGSVVLQAQILRDQACVDENQARALVERAIEEAD